MIKYSAYANFLDQDDQHNAAELIRRRFDTMVESMVEALSLNQVDSPKAIQITDSEEAMF